MNKTGKFPKPSPDYECPLCQDHENDIYAWSQILQMPICDVCDYEIWFYVTCEETRRTGCLVIDDLEKVSGLSFDECRLIELEHAVQMMSKSATDDVELLQQFNKEIVRLKSIPGKRGAK